MASGIHLIPLARTVRQRWRNDGGWTREIAVDGSRDDWQWRLSLAEVETDGPFSGFPGIEREIVLIEGAGMAFAFEDGETHALTPEAPRLRFAGERMLHSRLLDGPTRDFNLMWRRGQVDAELWLRPLVGGSVLCAAAGETWGFHLVAGHAELTGSGQSLVPGDTLLVQAGDEPLRQHIDANGSAIVIRLRPAT